MNFTDDEIKAFKQIAKSDSRFIDLDWLHHWLHEAQSEVAKRPSNVRFWQNQIKQCKQRISLLKRFEIWLEQNNDTREE